VGTDDNFFQLGGDSILSIQLVSRARRAGLLLAPRDIFQCQTVESLAEIARTDVPAHSIPSEAMVMLPPKDMEKLQAAYSGVQEFLPLSPLQEGLVFHALYDATVRDVYTVQLAIEFEGALDARKMQAAAKM